MARNLSESLLIQKGHGEDCSTCNILNQYDDCSSVFLESLRYFMQKFLGTYLFLFAGFAAIASSKGPNSVLPFQGVAIVWGLDAMVMTYTVSYISGAHFNRGVTLAFAIFKKFPWKYVLPYISVQILASTLASVTIQTIYGKNGDLFLVTVPSGSHIQSLAMEFMITFYLLFSVYGVATNQAIKELAGLATGAGITINTFIAGSISGASMNLARSLGPAIAYNYYTGIWIYILGPASGSIAGTWSYAIIKSSYRPTDIPVINRSSNGVSPKQATSV